MGARRLLVRVHTSLLQLPAPILSSASLRADSDDDWAEASDDVRVSAPVLCDDVRGSPGLCDDVRGSAPSLRRRDFRGWMR